jgi:hypothetical protein
VVGQMQIIVLLKKLEDLMAVFKHYLITRKWCLQLQMGNFKLHPCSDMFRWSTIYFCGIRSFPCRYTIALNQQIPPYFPQVVYQKRQKHIIPSYGV